MGILGPVLVVVLLLCAVGAFLQVGPGFNPETLYPKMARLSWRSRRPDPSRAAADGGLRVLLMMALVGIGASAVVAILSAAARRPWRGLQEGLEASSGFFADLSFQTLTVLAVFAIGDLLLQRHRHRQDVRMSRAQKQRDQRESQSGPITRRRRRGQRRAEKWSLGIEKLPLCLVVVSDGKDHAAALQYRPGQDPTPRVLSAARGVGAGSILAGARSLGLPVHQDGPLAAALTLVEPGLAVPESLYAAVAAVVLGVSGENSMPANP
jgi:flagellar biosynthesis protein FlhB